jgi:hypothetical protein
MKVLAYRIFYYYQFYKIKKAMFMLSAFKKITMASLLFTAFAACKKDTETVTVNVNNPVYNLRGNASGKQEVPVNASTATGTITGTYDKDKNLLTYTINWVGLTGGNASAGHFHGPADPGVNASVIVPFANFPATASGTYSGTATLTAPQETDFTNGLWYYNIHNATFPGGEIRGQIFLTQ